MVGTVPVYLGDSTHLKSLLPHPNAAIFVYDYNNNYESLANYLKYLMKNQSAYEEHRCVYSTLIYLLLLLLIHTITTTAAITDTFTTTAAITGFIFTLRAWRYSYNYTQHRMSHPLLIDSW